MKKHFSYISVFLITILFNGTVISQVQSTAGPVKITGITGTGISLLINPDFTIEKCSIDGESYSRITVRNASMSGLPGTPLFPKITLHIAIPENARPIVHILSVQQTTKENILLAPAGSTVNENNIAVFKYSADRDAYLQQTFSPADVVTLSGTGYFRNYRIATVEINPVQFNPAKRQAKLYSSIKCVVEYNVAGNYETKNPVAQSGNNLPAIEKLVLNPQQAETFKVKHTMSSGLKKGAGPAEGETWYTCEVTDNGIYEINYQTLTDAGISPETVDPAKIRIFNGGGRELPVAVDQAGSTQLFEIPLQRTQNGNSSFEAGESVRFYGFGISGWDYHRLNRELTHYHHHFDSKNVFWISFGQDEGKNIPTESFNSAAGAYNPSTFQEHIHIEDEKENIYHSGLDWYGDQFFSQDIRTYTVQMPGYTVGQPVRFRIAFKGFSSTHHLFRISVDGVYITDASFYYGNKSTVEFMTAGSLSSSAELTLQYVSSNDNTAYLDWIEVFYPREFTTVDGMLEFSLPDTNAPVTLSLADADYVWDITDLTDIRSIEMVNGQISDTLISGNIHRYAGFSSGAVKQVSSLEKVQITGLREKTASVDQIIISHSDFYDEALELKSIKTANGINTEVVNTKDIFNEFSYGIFDPAAIRNFLKFAYENWGDFTLRSVLLFGDGNYDYRKYKYSTTNWIPPYEIESNYELVTRCSDDWYTYISGNDRIMDLAIGRYTVSSAKDARSVVEKFRNYVNDPLYGIWRTKILFSADDEIVPTGYEETLHTNDSESLAESGCFPSYINKNKVYLMEYPSVRAASVSGIRKPKATEAFLELVNRGTNVINYVGHGNYRLLAHEELLNMERDMELFQNGEKYFFFYISSCAFGKFDNPQQESMCEKLLLLPAGGAIGLISSTRDVFADQNAELNKAFYAYLFSDPQNPMTTGQALMLAKNSLPNNYVNNEKYHLLGDPELQLGFPRYQAELSDLEPDSFKALALVKGYGSVLKDGTGWNDFAGKMEVSAFNSNTTGKYITENGETVLYNLSGSPLFTGKGSVKDGSYSFGFIVPKDITYGGQNGRISIYYWNNNSDGTAAVDNIFVGGTAEGGNDTEGPEIQISFKDHNFSIGDIVSEGATLELTLYDPNGINVTGEIGHKIEMVIDEKTDETIDLSGYFSYSEDSYSEGTILYPMSSISTGNHTVKIRAWDNYNNSSVSEAWFTIVSSQNLIINQVFNYPNPFTDKTQFTFQINMPAEVAIKIFTVNGRLIERINDIMVPKAGFFASDFWDGTDMNSDRLANGVYLYRIKARSLTDEEKTAEATGKIVIAR